MAAVRSGHPLAGTCLSGQPVSPCSPAAFPTQTSLLTRSLWDFPTRSPSGTVGFTWRQRILVRSSDRTGFEIPGARDDAQGQNSPSNVVAPAEEASGPGAAVKSRLDMLELYTGQSNQAATISEQLARVYDSESSDDDAEEVSIPLRSVEKVEPPSLTIHQKRNIRRQNYLNQVAKRNDAPFFAVVAMSILLPPACILAVAIATGYVEILP